MLKMKKSIYFLLSLIALNVLLTACDPLTPQPPTPVADKGELNIEWKHYVGNEALVLHTGQYLTAGDEAFSVDMFKYYISNIRLKKTDGSYFTYPKDDSYFLINAEEANSQITNLKNIPVGEYTDIEFTIGVDSAKNYSPVTEHIGALDAGNGMFWTWNTGYIFWKLEGLYTFNGVSNNQFTYHIAGAGFNSPNNTRTRSIAFNGDKLSITSTTKPELHIKVDIAQIFNSAKSVPIHSNPSVTDFSTISSTFASVGANMFSYILIH